MNNFHKYWTNIVRSSPERNRTKISISVESKKVLNYIGLNTFWTNRKVPCYCLHGICNHKNEKWIWISWINLYIFSTQVQISICNRYTILLDKEFFFFWVRFKPFGAIISCVTPNMLFSKPLSSIPCHF